MSSVCCDRPGGTRPARHRGRASVEGCGEVERDEFVPVAGEHEDSRERTMSTAGGGGVMRAW